MKVFVIGTMLWLSMSASGQQTPPAAAGAQHPSAVETMSMTPGEEQQLSDAWKDFKIAQLQLQLMINAIKDSHADWQNVIYDYGRQQFVKVLPSPAASGKVNVPAKSEKAH